MTWVVPRPHHLWWLINAYWTCVEEDSLANQCDWNRLGLPKQHRLVKVVGGYCVLGYVVVVVCFLAVWCRPIQQYWAVPPQNCTCYYTSPSSSPRSPVSSTASKHWTNILPSVWTAQCASYYHHLITDAVFNISSDLMMLFLPLPLLIKAKLPLKRYVKIFEPVNHWLERARLIFCLAGNWFSRLSSVSVSLL